MKNKGFTLVELLAVIAILAILVIIALPNVLKMFNDAKKNSFLTEAKTVYSEAGKKYISDSITSPGNNEYIYCKSKTDSLNLLSLSGRGINYYIKTDSNGNVNTIVVWDDTRYVAKKDSKIDITSLTASKDITDNIKNATCDTIAEVSGLYVKPDKNVSDLAGTSWKLNDNGYEYSSVATSISTANRLSDMPGAKLNFTSNGKQYIGIDSLYLPFPVPGMDLELSFNGVKTMITNTGFEKINFPFGNTIEAKQGVIVYTISDSEGVYIPYYQKVGWYLDNNRIINIIDGDDTKNQIIIDWFKKHGERVK